MWKSKLRLRLSVRITATVILLSFLTTFPVSAEPLTGQQQNLTGSGTRLYSEYEIDLLIDALTEAAHEEIQKAAAEAAKEAVLSAIEREALLLQARAEAMREATLQQAEALRWRQEAERQMKAVKETKRVGIKNAIITGAVCLLGGLIIQNLLPCRF